MTEASERGEPRRPRRWNETDDPKRWAQREAFLRARALERLTGREQTND